MTGPHGVRIPILGKGSRFGARSRRGSSRLVHTYRRKPGTMIVRLRLNARGWRPGAYRLRVVALDPGDGRAADAAVPLPAD